MHRCNQEVQFSCVECLTRTIPDGLKAERDERREDARPSQHVRQENLDRESLTAIEM